MEGAGSQPRWAFGEDKAWAVKPWSPSAAGGRRGPGHTPSQGLMSINKANQLSPAIAGAPSLAHAAAPVRAPPAHTRYSQIGEVPTSP